MCINRKINKTNFIATQKREKPRKKIIRKMICQPKEIKNQNAELYFLDLCVRSSV